MSCTNRLVSGYAIGATDTTTAHSVSTTYGIEVIQLGMGSRLAELEKALAEELKDIGLQNSITVEVRQEAFTDDQPSVAVYYGTPDTVGDAGLGNAVRRVLSDGVPVIPVLDSLAAFSESVPRELAPLNGWEWSGPDAARRLARILLEMLGIEDRQRRVFISHKRGDGLWAAEQLHDELSHHKFTPFIDRFAIREGERFQDEIADALEDQAFLLLLETPTAHDSKWVFDEVEYALSHGMGILILRWPGDPEPVPGSQGVPRLHLSPADVEQDTHGFDVLTNAALARVLAAVEAAHAVGIVRRRRMLTCSVEEAARAAGCTCVQEGAWRLIVEHAGGSTLVELTPRLPSAEDLQRLDEARAGHVTEPAGMLVHSARILRAPLKGHLGWVMAGKHKLTLTPENAVGGQWP
jgi:TIR domain